MAENHSKNHRIPPDFSPGVLCRVCAGAVAAVGLPSPAFLYPRRLALCGRLCAPLCGVSAAGSIGIAPPPCVALWAFTGGLRRFPFPGGSVPLWGCAIACTCAPLWAWLYGTACTRGGSVHLCAAVPGLWLLRSVPLSIVPAWPVAALWAAVCYGGTMDREKPGQAVQAPPGRKRTAAGIAPGAALWFHLFIFSNSDRIANGIIKSTSKINIFDFHPLYYAALYCFAVGVSCTSRRISFIAAFMAALVSFLVLYPVHHPGEY